MSTRFRPWNRASKEPSKMSMTKKLALSTIAASIVTFLTTSAFAQPFGGAARAVGGAGANEFDVKMWAAAAAGFAIGIGALGGTLGQGRAVAAALEGVSRNPGAASKIQPQLILGLALIESLVLFAFAIAYLLNGKV
jgi:F-type H+-transporting ATPase subunit c